MVFEVIRDDLMQMLGCSEDRIQPSTVLLEDLELEPADLCELMLAIEGDFPISWSEEDLSELTTVESLVRFIENQM